MANFERQLIWKVYTEDGTFIETLDDVISDLSIVKKINGGDGEFIFSLDRKMDDFDEGTSIEFNNRVKVYLKDEFNPLGDKLVANGYIIAYSPFLRGKEEGVEVTCLSAFSKLSNDFYRTGNALAASQLGVELVNQRTDQMMEAILTHYDSTETNSMISTDFANSDSTTDNTGSLITFTHRFFNMRHLDALREASKFLARNKSGGYWWYWRIDTDGKLYVKNLSTTADHTFIIGKHVDEISGSKSVEDMVNRVYFWNEKGTIDPDYLKLTNDDSTSQSTYDVRASYIADSKITNSAAANLLTASRIADGKDPKVKIKVKLNGTYDLSSIKPGDTCKILNAKENPYKIGADDVLLINTITYSADEAVLEISNAHEDFEDIVENERQRLDKEMTWFGFITQELTAAQLGPANRTWSTTVRFTATSGSDAYRQVDWTAGIVYVPGGASGTAIVREIAAGTTGFMAADTDYTIYLDEIAKPTTSTASESGTGTIEEGAPFLTDGSKSWSADEWAGYVVVINSERRAIVSNTTTVLTTSAEFDSDFTGSYDISKWEMSVTSTQSVATAVSKVIFSTVNAVSNTASEAIFIPAGPNPSVNIDGSTQIANVSIPDGKISDLTVDKLTTGTISSKQITLAVTPGGGDVYIAAGKTDFTNVDPGFILGVDDSDSDLAKFYIGNSTHYLNWTGTQLDIAGNISATSLDIGGADDTSFHVDIDGNMWLGAATFNISTNPFAVSNAGLLRAVSGTIGGNTLGTDFISSVDFASGTLGKGWKIDSAGIATFQEARIRGSIKGAVFEKDTISSVGGLVLVSNADILEETITAVQTTIKISGETTFSVDEVLLLKDGTNTEYMIVASTASTPPIYTVTREISGTAVAWEKSTPVVSLGVGSGTKTGYILLDSSTADSPFIDIYSRETTAFDGTTLHARIGWLQGITDADVGLSSTDTWGIYTDNAYIKGTIVATSGKIGTTSDYWSIGATGITAVSSSTDVIINFGKTDFGQDSTNGFILGYDFSASKSKLEIGSDANNLFKYDGTNLTLVGGTVTGGTIQTAVSGTRFIMTAATQRYEAINANGDIVGTMNWSSTSAAVLKLTPTHDARRALEIIIPVSFAGAGSESDAKAITIDNQADSITIDITNGGLTALDIQGCSVSAIDINHVGSASALIIVGAGSAACVDLTGATYPAMDITQDGTSSTSYGIRITQGTAALKEGIFIDDNANSHLSESIYIDRDLNSSSLGWAMKIDSNNAGSGNSGGIDFGGMPTGVNKGRIFNVPTDNTDPTSGGGGASGRIAIQVGASTRYLAYYT